MTTAVSATSAASSATSVTSGTTAPKTGFASLGAGDFIKMLSAQLAQFTSLSATTSMGSTLTQIAGKLDTMISELGQVIAAGPPAAGNGTSTGATTTPTA